MLLMETANQNKQVYEMKLMNERPTKNPVGSSKRVWRQNIIEHITSSEYVVNDSTEKYKFTIFF